ncbi:Transcription initiation factor TFIID subunit 10 [Purpureocillium lavendulum]|uniref:Transcription initiation factor TFIID subunit 10 n=1 Tax=Purpureocillium lavendulum TaxID=1247861 RepID=A0AB34FB04_9HYPO|nr:Transcription initiation factor TFIID subunit 10 [Purpureocillium lavendulum]
MGTGEPENTDSQAPPTVSDKPQPSHKSSQPLQSQPASVVEGPNPPAPAAPTGPEARAPSRMNISLREFLHKMEGQIPDAVTHHYMTKAGLPPAPQTNPRLTRLIALATQKFVADIAADAYQYSRIRGASNTNNPMGSLGAAAGFPIPGQQAGGQAGGKSWQGKGGAGSAPPGIQRPGYGGGSQGGTQNRTVLTMEDLGMAVGYRAVRPDLSNTVKIYGVQEGKDIFKVTRWLKSPGVFRPPPLQVGETIVETQTGKAEALRQATLERRTVADDISDPWIAVDVTTHISSMRSVRVYDEFSERGVFEPFEEFLGSVGFGCGLERAGFRVGVLPR